MDTRLTPDVPRSDVTTTETASRITPSPAVPFREFVTRGAASLVRGAESAVVSLPGGSLVASAVRGGSGSIGGAVSAGPITPPAAFSAGLGTTSSAENPGTATGGPGQETPSVEQSLAQSQSFNLYYLQLQEQLAAENRSYSAMSNVLKARHDTVKNAIGNIR